MSPWIVTLEALAPFRAPFARAAGDPQPLPYLDCAGNRAARRASTSSSRSGCRPRRCARPAQRRRAASARSNFADAAYWTVAQLVAHHTVNGCNLQHRRPVRLRHAVRAAAPSRRGSLLELTRGRQAADHAGQRRAAHVPRGRRHGHRCAATASATASAASASASARRRCCRRCHRRRRAHDPQARRRRGTRPAGHAAALALRRDARRDPRASSSLPTSPRPSPS